MHNLNSNVKSNLIENHKLVFDWKFDYYIRIEFECSKTDFKQGIRIEFGVFRVRFEY